MAELDARTWHRPISAQRSPVASSAPPERIPRNKYKKLVAKVHERVSNSRQDFLHKLSRKLVDESQVIIVENLNVKGMVRNRKLSRVNIRRGLGNIY